MEILGVSQPTVERILKTLSSETLSLIEYQGAKKTGGYVLTKKGTTFFEQLQYSVVFVKMQEKMFGSLYENTIIFFGGNCALR